MPPEKIYRLLALNDRAVGPELAEVAASASVAVGGRVLRTEFPGAVQTSSRRLTSLPSPISRGQ